MECATVSKRIRQRECTPAINGSSAAHNGGEWWIDVNDGKYKMGKGKIDNPNVTFIASDKDWVADVAMSKLKRHVGLL